MADDSVRGRGGATGAGVPKQSGASATLALAQRVAEILGTVLVVGGTGESIVEYVVCGEGGDRDSGADRYPNGGANQRAILNEFLICAILVSAHKQLDSRHDRMPVGLWVFVRGADETSRLDAYPDSLACQQAD